LAEDHRKSAQENIPGSRLPPPSATPSNATQTETMASDEVGNRTKCLLVAPASRTKAASAEESVGGVSTDMHCREAVKDTRTSDIFTCRVANESNRLKRDIYGKFLNFREPDERRASSVLSLGRNGET